MKLRYTLIAFMLLTGCGGSSRYYMLAQPVQAYAKYKKSLPIIGVEKVIVPPYLQESSIAKQLSPTQIEFSATAKWSEDMEVSLTNRLIASLQKSFNHPDIYSYPWDLSKQADIKVKLTISRFIAYNGSVYLDASWKISDLRYSREHSRLFGASQPTAMDDEAIVTSMNDILAKLYNAIAEDINTNN